MRVGADGWQPESVVELLDPASGLEGALVIDRLVDGVAAGGIRRTSYPDLEAARREAASLARAMTVKCALAELPAGGAKAVVLDHDGMNVAAAYRALGEQVDALDGAYLCGPDVGTGPEELGHVRAGTDHVNPPNNDAAEATARGVLAGIRGVLAVVDGEPIVEGSRFVVQGYGRVGRRVADQLAREGGLVLVAETDPPARKAAAANGHQVIAASEATRTVCTVFVPCAMGGVLTERVADAIPARAICGSANEQLASGKAGEILLERGVACAPDVLVNAGGVVEGVLTAREGRTEAVLDEVEHRIAAIETRVSDVLQAARKRRVPPHGIALQRARQRLEGSKPG